MSIKMQLVIEILFFICKMLVTDQYSHDLERLRVKVWHDLKESKDDRNPS